MPPAETTYEYQVDGTERLPMAASHELPKAGLQYPSFLETSADCQQSHLLLPGQGSEGWVSTIALVYSVKK